MLCIEELINLDPFQQLSKEQLEWVCDRAGTVELRASEVNGTKLRYSPCPDWLRAWRLGTRLHKPLGFS